LALRRRLGLPTDRLLLLAIRHPATTARLDELIEAIHFLRATQPEVALIVGGAAPPQDELRLQVAALGLEEHVSFAGPIRELDLPGYYAAADLVVLPAHGVAGWGMTTVEALACGTPVVGTPCGAAPEVLRPLSPGLLFPGAGAGEMADWFRRHLPGVHQNVTLREQCRAYAARHFSWDTIMLQLELLFYEAASISAEQSLDAGRSQPERPIAEP
jgi:glycosyltransferase involved in cell wall biosynthesis